MKVFKMWRNKQFPKDYDPGDIVDCLVLAEDENKARALIRQYEIEGENIHKSTKTSPEDWADRTITDCVEVYASEGVLTATHYHIAHTGVISYNKQVTS